MTELFSIKTPQLAIIDFETTGLSPWTDYPTEIGVRVIGAHPFDARPYTREYSSLIKLPDGVEVPEFITNLTGLTTEKVNSEGKTLVDIYYDLMKLLGDAGVNGTIFVAHNANFDLGFLSAHLGIEPEHFLCTRSISILTAPHKNASLKNVYADYFPESDLEQQHRAMADIDMTEAILTAFMLEQQEGSFSYFKNTLVSMPDRELTYVPPFARVLDFTQKYQSKRSNSELVDSEYLAQLEEDAEKLSKLEAWGVDNWSGYDDALSSDDE